MISSAQNRFPYSSLRNLSLYQRFLVIATLLSAIFQRAFAILTQKISSFQKSKVN